MKLDERVAIITGAASGFGCASAILFAKEGAKVVVADLDVEGGQDTVKAIQANGGEAVFVKVDVAKENDVEQMIHSAVEKYGGIDILFNNAGIEQIMTPIELLSEETWDRVFAVNVKGMFLGTKHALPELKKTGKGVIINTASVSGIRARPGLSSYTASKGACIMLTKALAIELAEYGIRVNCINPVAAETPFMKNLSEENKVKFRSTIPLGRFATAEDIAFAALYLASDDASMVTGAELNVDGGRTI